MDNKVKIFVLVIVLLIVGTLATALTRGVSTGAPAAGKYDEFAQCLKDKGATFYGAFWCPHCQAQKKLFGTSVKFLPRDISPGDDFQIALLKKINHVPQ